MDNLDGFCSMRKLRLYAVLAALSCGLSGWSRPLAAAEGEGDLSLEALFELKSTTASKNSQSVFDAPGNVTVIPRDTFEKYGWNTLNDILYRQPGFGPGKDADHMNVSSRGIFDNWNNNHILHLVDGVPFNDPLANTFLGSEIFPLYFISSVEALRGPGSALYGSSATNGVVVEKTMTAAEVGPGRAQIRIGNEGTRVIDAAAGATNEWGSAVLAFESYETQGFKYRTMDGSGRLDVAGNPQLFDSDDARHRLYGFLKLTGNGLLDGLEFQYHVSSRSDAGFIGWNYNVPTWPDTHSERFDHAVLSYRAPLPFEKRIKQEYILSRQHNNMEWHGLFYPVGDSSYVNGAQEAWKTQFENYFGRAQWMLDLEKNGNVLAGFEMTRFVYGGDSMHEANFDAYVDKTTNQLVTTKFPVARPVGDLLAYLTNKPFVNKAFYTQFSSEELFSKYFSLTAGVRWDNLSFDYTDILDPDQKTGSRSLSQMSPRIVGVIKPVDRLSVKLMAGSAFRAPTPLELGCAHSLWNVCRTDLSPERLKTYEIEVDWAISKNLLWKNNFFDTTVDNYIGFGTAPTPRNLFNFRNRGIETELQFGWGHLNAFANYSFASRMYEQSLAPDVYTAAPDGYLAGDPAHKFNLGANYELGKHNLSGQVHYQGKVLRRDSDKGTQNVGNVGTPENLTALRGEDVSPWATLDMNYMYKPSQHATVRLGVRNLFNTDTELVKLAQYPADVRMSERTYELSAEYKF